MHATLHSGQTHIHFPNITVPTMKRKKKRKGYKATRENRVRWAKKAKREAAHRQVNAYLKAHGIEVPRKQKDSMRLFASELGFKFRIGFGEASMNDQLIALYDDPEFTAIGKRESYFYWSTEWRNMREQVFKKLGRNCLKCGCEDELHIDHIKPRSKYPELELYLDNLQVLCRKCNFAKSNRDETDYRKLGCTA